MEAVARWGLGSSSPLAVWLLGVVLPWHLGLFTHTLISWFLAWINFYQIHWIQRDRLAWPQIFHLYPLCEFQVSAPSPFTSCCRPAKWEEKVSSRMTRRELSSHYLIKNKKKYKHKATKPGHFHIEIKVSGWKVPCPQEFLPLSIIKRWVRGIAKSDSMSHPSPIILIFQSKRPVVASY